MKHSLPRPYSYHHIDIPLIDDKFFLLRAYSVLLSNYRKATYQVFNIEMGAPL